MSPLEDDLEDDPSPSSSSSDTLDDREKRGSALAHPPAVEGWVDPHVAGQLKSNRYRVYNLLNNKRPNELGGQLLGLHPQ